MKFSTSDRPPASKISKIKPKVQDMQVQDEQFEFDNQFDNLREDDDFLLEDGDANEALKDIEIEQNGQKLPSGNFADLNLSQQHSEESDGGLEFDTGAKNDTFQFSN